LWSRVCGGCGEWRGNARIKLLAQRVGHEQLQLGLAMLCDNILGYEDVVIFIASTPMDTLPLPKSIRHHREDNYLVLDRVIREHEARFQAARRTLEAASHHHATDAEKTVLRRLAGGNVARRVVIKDVLLEGGQRERDGTAHSQEDQAHQQHTPTSWSHACPPRPISARRFALSSCSAHCRRAANA